MSLAQRLAWFEGLSTVGIVTAMLAISRPAGQDPMALGGIAARASLVVLVCSAAFYSVKHMSLPFDLRILFDTVKFVLCGKRPG